MRWYDEALVLGILAMTVALIMILGAGVAQDAAEYYNIPPPPPCAAEYGTTCPIAGK